MTPPPWDTLYLAEGLLGYMPEGNERAEVRIEIRRRPGNYRTIEHDPIVDPLELAVTGAVYLGARRESEAAGQCIDAVAEVSRPVRGLTDDDVTDLVLAWRGWHLNTMTAGCAHQTVVYDDRSSFKRPDLRNTPPCPHTGYRFGDSWLVTPLPAEVEQRVRYIGDRLQQPAARRPAPTTPRHLPVDVVARRIVHSPA